MHPLHRKMKQAADAQLHLLIAELLAGAEARGLIEARSRRLRIPDIGRLRAWSELP